MVTRIFRGIGFTDQYSTLNGVTLTLGENNDFIYAAGGDNTVYTGNGANVVLAGVGYDSISNYAGRFNAYLAKEAISYKPILDAGNNTIYAGSGDDYVVTGYGNDLS